MSTTGIMIGIDLLEKLLSNKIVKIEGPDGMNWQFSLEEEITPEIAVRIMTKLLSIPDMFYDPGSALDEVFKPYQ